MDLPSRSAFRADPAPEHDAAMADALHFAQSRARESERLVEEYDARFSAAVKRIRDYVDEGWDQMLVAQHRAATVEKDLAEAQRMGNVDQTRISAMLSTHMQLRQQASILEMEFQRRKRLQAQLDLFNTPTPTPHVSVTPLVSPTPQGSSVTFAIDPSSLRAPAPAPASSAPPTSPWPTPAITPRPSPAPSPSPGTEAIQYGDSAFDEGDSIQEMRRRVRLAEERARQAEEERTMLELRLRSLVAALDEDSRSVGAMRTLCANSLLPFYGAIVSPFIFFKPVTLTVALCSAKGNRAR